MAGRGGSKGVPAVITTQRMIVWEMGYRETVSWNNNTMNSTTKTARPTEYMGTTYRSKSEAMFARYLDLSLSDHPWGKESGFVYEPDFLNDTCGVAPDFYVYQYPKKLSTAFISLIEYKPVEPTECTIVHKSRELLECSRKVVEFINKKTELRQVVVSCTIFFGSVYNDSMGRILCLPDGGFIRDNNRWIDGYEDSIKSYRYDLVDKGASIKDFNHD